MKQPIIFLYVHTQQSNMSIQPTDATVSFQNLKYGTGSHSVSAAGLSSMAEWPSSPAVVIFHRGQQLRMWSMQQPQTCFSPLNNPHGVHTKTYLLLLPYSNSAFTWRTTERVWKFKLTGCLQEKIVWPGVAVPHLASVSQFRSWGSCEQQC